MKNVLVPLDFYSDARQVLKDLLSFFRDGKEGLKVFLLDTYMVPVSASGQVIHAHDELRHRSLDKLQKELRIARESSGNGKVSFEAVSEMGTPANVISRVIREKGIDCVVLGAKGGTGGGPKEEIVNLLNRIHCPVVVL